MASRRPPPLLPFDYVSRTRALPVNLLFLMPWVLVYELALFGTRSPVENAAAAWFRALVDALGREATIGVTLLACVALLLVVLNRAREAPDDRGVYGGMLVEGLCYGAVLGICAGMLAHALPMERIAPLANPAPEGFHRLRLGLQDLALAIGAGIFEELAFRGILCAGLYVLLRHGVGAGRWVAGPVAILVSAYLFSDYHHWGAFGEPENAAVFAFRFHAGVLLGAIFLTRGLGIAAFAHGFYDVLVMLQT
jgi:membrane protease YdiL (CAAX protease family)